MKKLFALFVAVLFLSGYVFAQDNEAYITQVGTNTANVDQTGTVGGNTANVNQYGANIADVKQLGVGSNTATVHQGSGGTPVTNNHQAAYSGDWQDGAFITQNGESNDASITMAGASEHNSTGTIYQKGNSNSGSQNIGTPYSEMSGAHAGVKMTQIGDNNSSTQKTTYAYGVAGIKDMTVNQQGNGNSADQKSIAGYGSVLSVSQKGDDNISDQYQAQIGGFAKTTVVGNSNNTSQHQDDPNHNGHVGFNEGTININGDSNIATEWQVGRDNQATINVNSSNLNEAHIKQTNDTNVATISQSGAGGNYANINQH